MNKLIATASAIALTFSSVLPAHANHQHHTPSEMGAGAFCLSREEGYDMQTSIERANAVYMTELARYNNVSLEYMIKYVANDQPTTNRYVAQFVDQVNRFCPEDYNTIDTGGQWYETDDQGTIQGY